MGGEVLSLAFAAKCKRKKMSHETRYNFVLQGDVQELAVIPDPAAAFRADTYYTPQCDQPFEWGNSSYFWNTSTDPGYGNVRLDHHVS